MMPQQTLSDSPHPAAFLSPRNLRTSSQYLSAYEQGGIALNNSTEGLQYQNWSGAVGVSGDFVLTTAAGESTTVINVQNVKEWDFTFDQNMSPFFAYTLNDGTSYIYWFDALSGDYTTTQMPEGSVNLRCSLDDKRPTSSGTSDIVLSYVRSGTLFMRQQRDRYGVEYTLSTAFAGKRQIQAGLNALFRYQFEITP
jgi:hypothetical protein